MSYGTLILTLVLATVIVIALAAVIADTVVYRQQLNQIIGDADRALVRIQTRCGNVQTLSTAQRQRYIALLHMHRVTLFRSTSYTDEKALRATLTRYAEFDILLHAKG